jgi:Transglycosylase SLT domain
VCWYLYLAAPTKAASVMKHLHIILLLSSLLFLSPVVYATMSLNQSPTKAEAPVVTVQRLILESTNGQKTSNSVSSSSIFIAQSSVVSDSSSSDNSITSSTLSSISSSNSSTKLNVSLENLGQSAKSFSSSSKDSSNSSSFQSEIKLNTVIEAKRTESQVQKSSSITYSSSPEIKVEQTIITVEEKKVSPIVVTSSQNVAQKENPKENLKEISKESSTENQVTVSSSKPETKTEVKVEEAPKENPKPKTYHELIDYYCDQYGCNPVQLKRVMRCESTNNPNARNGIHIGLFQFNPNTFKAYAAKAGIVNPDIWDAEDQIQTASYMFANGQARQWSCK